MNRERWQQVKQLLEEALAFDDGQRPAFLERASQGDAELRREVESLLSSHNQAGTGFLKEPVVRLSGQTTAAAAPARDQRVGAYQLAEEIGHGGMGEVYRAVRADGQYTKEVAIKLVRSGFESGTLAERFRNERQILASLDHPNIARLLDGGSTADGVPYLVMELIRGVPIDTYCDDHSLTVSDRLQLFRQVCEAVQYAHQRLVIHRDIKPSNILVTEDATPKLLDFGLAKLLDPSSSNADITMMRAMTPEYASPEQIRGETITTASDVYSLGVVLYRLLTRRSPYTGDTSTPHGLARAICDDDPIRPSTAILNSEESRGGDGTSPAGKTIRSKREDSRAKLRRRLSGDLDNVVLRALRKETSLRYASAEQLSDDLRQHLAGLPVKARQDSWTYRAGKFAKRHKLGLAATVLIVIALLAGAIATLREARIAAAHERRAERRFNDVRQLANSLMFDIHDSIQDLPGSIAARKLLVEKALQYLDSLNEESGGELSLQRELAAAYKRIGDLQGYPYSANLGDSPGALKSYQKSLVIRKVLLNSNPSSVDAASELAESFRLTAEILLTSGEITNALENSQHAVQISEQSAQAHPRDVKVLQELVRDYEIQANIMGGDASLSNFGDNATAMQVRHKQLEVSERIATLQPDDPSMKRSLAVSIGMMGDQLWLGGERSAALLLYRRAQLILENLAVNSQNVKVLDNLDGVYERLVAVELSNGNWKGATAVARQALAISKKLKLADPRDTLASLDLAVDYGDLGDAVSRTGNFREAITAVSQAVIIMNDLTALNPSNTEFRTIQSTILITAGDIFARSQNYPQAVQNYRSALANFSKIVSAEPSNMDARLRLAVSYNKVGSMLVRQSELKEAVLLYQKALGLAETEAKAGHRNEEALYITADSYARLAESEAILARNIRQNPTRQIEHWKQACSWYESSLNVWSQIKEPGFISPNIFDAIPIPVVSGQLAACQQRLQELQAAAKFAGRYPAGGDPAVVAKKPN